MKPLQAGDQVDVYIPVGEPPYEHETRTVVSVDFPEGLVLLDDGSTVGLGYCTKLITK